MMGIKENKWFGQCDLTGREEQYYYTNKSTTKDTKLDIKLYLSSKTPKE